MKDSKTLAYINLFAILGSIPKLCKECANALRPGANILMVGGKTKAMTARWENVQFKVNTIFAKRACKLKRVSDGNCLVVGCMPNKGRGSV